MTWIKNTGSKYHTQDTGYYCGAASAMMVLAEIGVGYGSLDQDDLYTSNHDHNVKTGWATDPEGLKYTMIHRKPATFGNTFVIFRAASEAEGSRKILDTLRIYGVSPIVLVYGCMHWIVVVGVQTNVNPATGAYSIDGFWVNNSVHEDNEPHSATDACGTGGSHGIENQWVSYNSWQNTYLTGCNYDSSTGALQYISVCDPDIPKIELPTQMKPLHYFEGAKLAPAAEIFVALNKEIKRMSLLETKQLSPLRKGNFGAPMLVRRMDKRGSYYYLTPFVQEDMVIGYAQSDAYFGNLDGVFMLKKEAKMVEVNPDVIVKKLAGKKIEMRNLKGRIKLNSKLIKVSKVLVWRPCQQSFSPHLPFWRITVGGSTIYQRIDGPVFSQLTFDGKGI
jgi:hypothetical protein